MFHLSCNKCNGSIGNHSGHKRRSELNHVFCKTSKRLIKWVVRDGTVLSVLALLAIVIQLGQRMQTIASFLQRDSTEIDTMPGQHIRNIAVQQASGPPSYLPLAQHLRNINLTGRSPSLQDMAYGAQRKTQPDLMPTNNDDLNNCGRCKRNYKRLLKSNFASSKSLKLVRTIAKVITFYDISSMLVVPCEKEVHWLLPLVKAVRVRAVGVVCSKLRICKQFHSSCVHYTDFFLLLLSLEHIQTWSPSFKHFCVLPNDAVAVNIIKTYGPAAVNGTMFVRYKPFTLGGLPKVDMVFSWRGLEQFSLEDIHQVFKDIVLSGTKYTLIGSSPGHPNAKMVESRKDVYSVVRPKLLALNVRAFPFGFNKAERVIPLLKMQLLFYNSSQMRDTW